jgi:hypothetical protein
MIPKIQKMLLTLPIMAVTAFAQATSPYMGGDVTLTEAPNGAIVREDVLTIGPQISYTEPTIDKVANGLWSFGGYSLANTSVIEGDDGLIVYETGKAREEIEGYTQ